MSVDNHKHVLRGRAYIKRLLQSSACYDCGLSNWLVLQFDHREPKDKAFSICDNHSRSLKTLQAEIDKCDIVCANCHLMRTARMFGSWRLNGD